MQNTRNYNLKKPDYTDFADIKDINDNMDKLDEELAAPTGDTADSTATFTCSDVADGDAAAWTNVPALTSGETHKSIFAKMSQMFKNLRYLYKLLGTTDISSIGNGTVTGGLSSLNDSLNGLFKAKSYSCQFSVGPNATASITGNDLGVSVPSGYTPVILRNCFCLSPAVRVYSYDVSAAGTNAVFFLANTSNTTVTGTLRAIIVYVRVSSYVTV